MLKRLLIGVVVIGTAMMVIRSLPDIRRYKKIRSM
jgi:hypothetical protein